MSLDFRVRSVTTLLRVGTRVTPTPYRSFRQRFEAAVLNFGDMDYLLQVAANGQACRKTFSQIGTDVETVRAQIRSQFSGYGILATHAGNSYPHLVWMLAILLENKILCPMNPRETLERTTSKLAMIGEPFLLVSEDVRAVQQLAASPMVIPGIGAATLNSQDELPARDPDAPFILIFTSGTTGHSKIVQQTERGVLANVDDLIRHHRLSPKDRICTPLPIFHVNALEFSFFSSVFSGAGLVLFERFDCLRILKVMGLESVSILSIIPQMAHLLVQQAARFKKSRGERFRYVLTAAAPLSPALAREWISKFGDKIRILQGYGLSEAVNFSATMPPDLSFESYRHLMLDYQRPSVGVALEGNDIFVVDGFGQPCRSLEHGEICIRGTNVMLGYRGHAEEQTFAGEMLHTGDTGFYVDMEQRRFFFVAGRIKDVIKTLGETVSLVEIDDVLLRLAPKTEAIAVGFPNDFEGEAIGIVVKSSTTASADDVIRLIKAELPMFMWPHKILRTDEDVKTASGKSCRWKFVELFKSLEHLHLGRESREGE